MTFQQAPAVLSNIAQGWKGLPTLAYLVNFKSFPAKCNVLYLSVGFGISPKYYTRLDRLASSSLFDKFSSYEDKSLENMATGSLLQVRVVRVKYKEECCIKLPMTHSKQQVMLGSLHELSQANQSVPYFFKLIQP